MTSKPDCAACGRPYHAHSGGFPNTCPIIATYRPQEAALSSQPVAAAEVVEALMCSVHRLALLAGDVNMNDPLSKWFTVANLYEAKEAYEAALQAAPSPSPEVDAMMERLRAMRDFLNGERALDGTWFGECPAPNLVSSKFWWRRPMHRDLTAAIEALSARDGRTWSAPMPEGKRP